MHQQKMAKDEQVNQIKIKQLAGNSSLLNQVLNNQESYWQLNIYFFLLGLKHAKILANNLIIDPKSKKRRRRRFDSHLTTKLT